MTTNFDTRLASYSSPVLSVFRIVFGLLYMLHGSMKLFAWPLGTKVPVGTWPFWWAGLIEFILGLLIVVGLFTRIAAFIASGEMAFAYFYQHWPPLKGGPSASFWPFDAQQLGGNGGELAIMFCFAFLLLATTGAGAWSADTRRRVGVGRTGATAGAVVTGRAAPRARGGMLSRFRRR